MNAHAAEEWEPIAKPVTSARRYDPTEVTTSWRPANPRQPERCQWLLAIGFRYPAAQKIGWKDPTYIRPLISPDRRRLRLDACRPEEGWHIAQTRSDRSNAAAGFSATVPIPQILSRVRRPPTPVTWQIVPGVWPGGWVEGKHPPSSVIIDLPLWLLPDDQRVTAEVEDMLRAGQSVREVAAAVSLPFDQVRAVKDRIHA